MAARGYDYGLYCLYDWLGGDTTNETLRIRREMLEELLLGLWPQLVALVAFAWLVSRLSEKVAQAEKKIETLFVLFNKMKDDNNRS